MIFRLEAVPESTVRRYFLQVSALLNLRFPGSRMPVGSTATGSYSRTRIIDFYCTGCTGNEGGTQRGEIGLLLRPVPPDDIRNITAIAKKLRRSVVVQEPFEFAIRAAHTVKI